MDHLLLSHRTWRFQAQNPQFLTDKIGTIHHFYRFHNNPIKYPCNHKIMEN